MRQGLGIPILTLLLGLLLGLLAHASVDPARLVHARTGAEARDTLEYLRATLTDDDGVSAWNEIYLATTRNVLHAVESGRFENGAFMDRFTGEFASLYFSALHAQLTGKGRVPLAWRAVFEHGRHADRHWALQFGIAGLSAHIGRDLPLVLEALFDERKAYPASDSAEFRDFLLINEILRETFAQVEGELFRKQRHRPGALLLRKKVHEVAVPSLRAAKYKAWFDGKVLWTLRAHPVLFSSYLTGLDVGVAGWSRTVFTFRRSVLRSAQ